VAVIDLQKVMSSCETLAVAIQKKTSHKTDTADDVSEITGK